jgi:hypothetical protein
MSSYEIEIANGNMNEVRTALADLLADEQVNGQGKVRPRCVYVRIECLNEAYARLAQLGYETSDDK